MADFSICGFIEGIRYSENNVIVTVSERRQGYKKRDGSIVDDTYFSYSVLFKDYFKKHVANNFGDGMYVKIKGILYVQTQCVGETHIKTPLLIGQTIDRESFPKNVKLEHRMIKDSQANIDIPSFEDMRQQDF